MAKLSRSVIQRLAVLRTISLWQNGAYEPVAFLHKTLFFTDKNSADRTHFFTFKRYYLGQYSQEISDSLNALKDSGRLECVSNRPAERLKAVLSEKTKTLIKRFFSKSFPSGKDCWQSLLRNGHIFSNDELLRKANDDSSYTVSHHDEVIFGKLSIGGSALDNLSDVEAERLSDLVDPKLSKMLRDKVFAAIKTQAANVDWRKRYFGGKRPAKASK